MFLQHVNEWYAWFLTIFKAAKSKNPCKFAVDDKEDLTCYGLIIYASQKKGEDAEKCIKFFE